MRALRALVIAHEPDGPACQVEVRLRERGFEVDTHVVTADYQKPGEAAPWPDFADYDVVLPMGSIRNLPNKEPIESWIHDELDLLRKAHETGQPILGICFGGQLMAEALGGTVEVAPVTELGWFELRALPGVENPAGPGPWKEWHHDRFHPPAEAEVLAETDNATQLFRIGKTVGTQFHPEVDVAHLENWLATCDDAYLHDQGTSREKILADAIEHEDRNIEQCHAFVDWWLDEVAFPEGLPGLAKTSDERKVSA
ncbi:MAG: type 1 glutamine amidotransferase [Actinomycetota bacterium]